MKLTLLTALTMVAFAANSVIARLALADGTIDAGTFSLARLSAGALVLTVLASNFSLGVTNTTSTQLKTRDVVARGGDWLSASALLVYIVGFSFAYLALDTGTGALILFAVVQATMIGWGIYTGAKPSGREWVGLVIAFAAFAYLVSPGLTAPSPLGSVLMVLAGIGWGAYSLRGRAAEKPLLATAGNFIRATILCFVFLIAFAVANGSFGFKLSGFGFAMAVLSGAVTSGMGYALWYYCLRQLAATKAAIVQLSVPAIATLGGVMFSGEELTVRLIVSCALILGGVGFAIISRPKAA